MIDINALFAEGASDEVILAAINKNRAEQEALKDAKTKEALKAEGRAYLINALLAYSEAFDLVEEEWTDEDIKDLEEQIIKLEAMVPMYAKLYKMRKDFDKDFFKGLM